MDFTLPQRLALAASGTAPLLFQGLFPGKVKSHRPAMAGLFPLVR